jgi:methanogenic corrinoid protein MtbC1
MGSRIAADFLEMAGFDVRLLGANVPALSLAERVEKEKPDLVALSATMTFHLPAIERAIAAVRATTVAEIPVLIGGRAFAWAQGAAARIDAQGFGGDADALVVEAQRLTRQESST